MKVAAILLSTALLAAAIVAASDGNETVAGTSCESDPVFDGGFEAGDLSEWDHVQALPGRATVERGGSFCGGSHARFEVREGDVEPETEGSRAELTGPSFSDGDDLWFRQATQLVEGFPDEDEYQIVTQWRSGDDSPPLALFVEGDTLELRRGDEPFTEFWQGPVSTDEWIDLIFHIRFSEDSSTGFVEVWRDGKRQTMINGERRIYGETIVGDDGDLKVGYYRSNDHEDTGVVLHDNFLIGDSLNDVAPPR